MRLIDSAFDTEQLYTTRWRTPHHQLLEPSRPHHVLGQTRAGRLILAELKNRNLSPADVSLSIADAQIVLSIPRGVGRTSTVLQLEGELDRAAVGEVRALLDTARANLVREWMMSAAGWRPNEPEPAWSRLTTPLAEIVFHASGYRSADVWDVHPALSDALGHLGAATAHCDDARDAIPDRFRVQRLGPLLKIEGTLGEDAAFAQGDHTRIAMRSATMGRTVLFHGQRAAGFGFRGEGPVGEYLETRRVKSARRSTSNPNDTLILELEVPVITQAEVPEAALAAIGMTGLPAGMKRFPLWTAVRKLPAAAFAAH